MCNSYLNRILVCFNFSGKIIVARDKYFWIDEDFDLFTRIMSPIRQIFLNGSVSNVSKVPFKEEIATRFDEKIEIFQDLRATVFYHRVVTFQKIPV